MAFCLDGEPRRAVFVQTLARLHNALQLSLVRPPTCGRRWCSISSRMPLSSHSKATSASQPSRLLMVATPRSLFATPVRVSNDRGTTDRRDRHANIDVGAGHEPRAN